MIPSRSSPLDDIIAGETAGLAVKPYNLKEFENKLAFLMENEDKLAAMSSAAKISVKRFGIASIADQWIDLFNKILVQKEI